MKNEDIMPLVGALFLTVLTVIFCYLLFDNLYCLSDIVSDIPSEGTRWNAEGRITIIELSAWILLFSSLGAWGSHLRREVKKVFKYVKEDHNSPL